MQTVNQYSLTLTFATQIYETPFPRPLFSDFPKKCVIYRECVIYKCVIYRECAVLD